jgi:hypothetical protein
MVHRNEDGDDDMNNNSGTFEWVDALVKIEEKRLAAQTKQTKKGKAK